jgi:Tfp pilus assembly protein PilN
MSWQAPNLAREPFLNLRPLRRAATALAVAAALLTAWNAVSYLRAGSGAAKRSAELSRLAAETAAARARLATIESDLASRDLPAENRRALFLNERIAQRTFDWNALFDRMAEVLPRGVRLRSLTPRLGAAPADGDAARTVVSLALDAEAEDGEAMLELVDNLFAHPSFASPNLSRESRQRGGEIDFDLTVDYFPETR